MILNIIRDTQKKMFQCSKQNPAKKVLQNPSISMQIGYAVYLIYTTLSFST